jgi:hypothetical protein
MPLPEQAPAARPIDEYAVMSWQWFVALVRCVPSPCVPPAHRPGDVALRVREDARLAHDARVLRPRERHLHDLDAEECGVRILVRTRAVAAGQLLVERTPAVPEM